MPFDNSDDDDTYDDAESARRTEATKDDKVGHCRPPKEHQFKPGQSGNPRGRPRGTRSLRADLMKVLATKVTIKDGDVSRRVTKREAIAHRLVQKAAMGDTRAILAIDRFAHEEEVAKNIRDNAITSFTLKIGERELRRDEGRLDDDDDSDLEGS